MRTSFVAYIIYFYRFLFNFVNSIILGYYLGLLAAIISKSSWNKEIHPIITQLGPIPHSGEPYFKGYSLMQNP